MRATLVTTLTVAALLLAGCGTDGEAGDVPDDDPISAPDEPTDGDAAEDGTAGDGDLDAETAAARADLAASAGVDPADIEVVVAERVTWRDGALGCPEPDQMYTQALVDGYRIVLAVGGDEVAYHGADGGPPARCDDPQPPA